jgi:sec-independent protein translocase protein TatC
MSKLQDMNTIQHLDEMRRRLIRVLLTFLVSVCAAFLYVRDIYGWLVSGMERKLVILGPSDVVWVYFMIAGVVAVAVTIPVAAYQIWKFVKPALSAREQKATMLFIPSLTILFMLGVSFGYFILFPMVLSFMDKMAAEDFQALYTAEKYFSFMLHMTLPFGFLFEMPAVVMFLTRLGILNPLRLAKMRKVAYFVLVIVAVVITPPDIMSDIIVIVPLFLLYEVSITLSKIIYRKQLRMRTDS